MATSPADRFRVPTLIAVLTSASLPLATLSEDCTSFVLALVALGVIVGAGLNILYGLSGQISLGHIRFYAIGAYTVGILSLKGIGLRLSLPAAGAIGLLLALPALRVARPYLAMVAIAFAFVVQHGAIEWRAMTGGANGLSGIPAPAFGARVAGERELAMFAIALAGFSLWLFSRIANSTWGKGMLAVRDSEVAARSLGVDPVVMKTAAFALSANPDVRRAYLGTELHTRRRIAMQPRQRERALNVLNLTAGAANVFDDFSFDIREGEMVAILGANGAGKTTIMRVLAGLLPASRAVITLGARRIDNLKPHEIAALGLALAPEGRQVLPGLSVQDNLELGASRRRGGDIVADIERMKQRFPRLAEHISTRAGLLSGGEQQMLAIARGLMAHPCILLLDEPSLGLAPQIIDEVFDVLSQLRDNGTTILLADQMAVLALTLADRGYVLERGRFVQSGTAEQLAMDPELESSYLGKTHA